MISGLWVYLTSLEFPLTIPQLQASHLHSIVLKSRKEGREGGRKGGGRERRKERREQNLLGRESF
jgi:hypothetical protein